MPADRPEFRPFVGWTASALALVVACGATGPAIALAPPGAGRQAVGRPTELPAEPADELVVTDPSELRGLLGGGTFDQRQRAMWRLWRQRAANHDAVSRASEDPDPEVSSRAGWILDRWRRGILPDTPPQVVRQLETTSVVNIVPQLLRLGLLSEARVALEEALGGGDEATLARAAVALQHQFPLLVARAADQHQLDELAELVDRLAINRDLLLCRNRLWQRLDKQPANRDRLRGQLDDSSAPPRLTAIVVACTQGRFAEAIRLAEQLDDPETLRLCLMLAGRWCRLAESQAELATSQPAGSPAGVRHWAYALIGAARCDDSPHLAEAVAALAEPVDDGVENDEAMSALRWQVLAMHGRMDEAAEIVRHDQPLVAADLLFAAGRAAEAMELVGLPVDRIDGSLSSLVVEARRAVQRGNASNLAAGASESLDRLLRTTRFLYQCGRRDAAWQLLEAAVQPWADGGEANPLPYYAKWSAMVVQRPDWLLRLIEIGAAGEMTSDDHRIIARLFDVERETVELLAEALSRLLAMERIELAEALFDFLAGDLPERFDAVGDHQRLFDLITTPPETARSRRGRFGARPELRLTSDMAELFDNHGQANLARRVRFMLASTGDQEAILTLAEKDLDDGRGRQAKEKFELVWQRLDDTYRGMTQEHGVAEHALAAMRAVLGRSIAQARLGDQEGAQEGWRLLDLMLCSPSPKLRYDFAEVLIDQGFEERAREVLQELVPWIAFGADEEIEFYRVAHRLSDLLLEHHPADSADYLDLGLVGPIESTAFRPLGYIRYPALVQRRKVVGAIRDDDLGGAQRHIERLLALNPIDIEFGENVIRQMRQAGWQDLADETIERIYQAGADHLQRFPTDVLTANNLAWVLALSDHRLDDALRLARTAVYFQPDSTVYRDTLAEVLYRQGRAAEAIAILQACLIDDPGEWHVHEQLQRFRGASGS